MALLRGKDDGILPGGGLGFTDGGVHDRDSPLSNTALHRGVHTAYLSSVVLFKHFFESTFTASERIDFANGDTEWT